MALLDFELDGLAREKLNATSVGYFQPHYCI